MTGSRASSRRTLPALSILLIALIAAGASPQNAAPTDESRATTEQTPPTKAENKNKADRGEREEDEAWQFRLTPYFWATSVSLSGEVGGHRFSGTLNFGEIIDDLGMAVLLAGEARKGDFFVGLNADFLRLKDDLKGPAGGDVTVSMKSAVVEATGGYRFAHFDLGSMAGNGSRSGLALEGLAGVRYYYNDMKVNPENAGSADKSFDWLDLVAGGRMIWSITDSLHFAARADLGGFDIGDSDLSCQAIAMLEYDVSDRVSIDLGYRYLSVGYEPEGTNNTALRMRMKGMIIGASFRF